MRIYINVTNSFQSLGRTGIQRVVKELVSGCYSMEDVQLVAFNLGAFHIFGDDVEYEKYQHGQSFVPKKRLALDEFQKNDVFFDIDASWGDPYDIETLFRYLKKQGVRIVKLHYDAVPILHSQYAHPNTVI